MTLPSTLGQSHLPITMTTLASGLDESGSAASQKLAAVRKAIRRLESARTLESLTHEIVQVLQETMGCDNVAVLLRDDITGDVSLFAYSNSPIKKPVEIRSELFAPLRAIGQLIGTVNVESARPEAYSELDQQLLDTLAMQIAAAIQNVRWRQRLERYNDQLERLIAERTQY